MITQLRQFDTKLPVSRRPDGYEGLEQAATGALETAMQSVVQTLDGIEQADSVAVARPSTDELLNHANRSTEGLLEQGIPSFSEQPARA